MNKLSNSILPTPLHKLNALSKLFGVNIFCKRDDLTGFAFGGNKTRKLDYLIAEAKRKRFNTIVTSGGFQSNFCRITAAYGAKENFKVHLLLGGKRIPTKSTANLLLMKMFGAKLHFVETEDWDIWEKEAKNLADKLTRKGEKVFLMSIGGSNVTGVKGYMECFDEIISFEKKYNIHFSNIIHATGSAGTQSGLILGKTKHKWKGNIIGIAVGKNSSQLYYEVLDLSSQAARKFKLQIKPSDIIIDDNYIGKCYGANTKWGDEAIKIFAKFEGIFLDQVYSGKAAAALIDYCRKNKFSKNENILFIHTGGNIHIFK